MSRFIYNPAIRIRRKYIPICAILRFASPMTNGKPLAVSARAFDIIK
jgi:hypothetical protein